MKSNDPAFGFQQHAVGHCKALCGQIFGPARLWYRDEVGPRDWLGWGLWRLLWGRNYWRRGLRLLDAKPVEELLCGILPCTDPFFLEFFFELNCRLACIFQFRCTVNDRVTHSSFVFWNKIYCIVTALFSPNADRPHIALSNLLSKCLLEKLPETAILAYDKGHFTSHSLPPG
jgi:hypothetical protein